MITVMRTAAAMALAVLPLSLPATATATAHALAAVPEVLPIGVAVSALQVAEESRACYTRTAFKHWNAGGNPSDGCNTRQEVLIAEADVSPVVGPRCTLTVNTRASCYDETMVNGAGGLDIDHMVPLAEAWDSGASSWTAARREAYANDQGQASSFRHSQGCAARALVACRHARCPAPPRKRSTLLDRLRSGQDVPTAAQAARLEVWEVFTAPALTPPSHCSCRAPTPTISHRAGPGVLADSVLFLDWHGDGRGYQRDDYTGTPSV
ncbi:HNH endonuclease family protein [Streptomyces sp. ISL-86]|uniref:HNH endonuclease family protein n=1 Tax=Streptomyces sp. ISL-86 TaxID=2819187 RepID=UPI002035D70C|nr:HNH endonuclease family protein [Streptomyces sp. ISL-86]